MLPKIYIFKIANIDIKKINLLPKSYIKKINTYKNSFVKKEAIASRLFLRYVLLKNGATNNILDKIAYNPNGKPLLERYFFNISHSNKYIACAIYDKHIGLDLEKIDIRFQKNKQYFLSADELKKNKSLTSLTKTWTQKEAFIKLKGKRISTQLNKLKINHCKVKSYKWLNYCLSIATDEQLQKFPKLIIVKFI